MTPSGGTIRRITTLLAISLLTALVSELSAEIIVSPVNNHRYRSINLSNWSPNQPLATVRSLEENSWIFETFGMKGGTPRALWIGLNDATEEGTLTWVSGETNEFTNWAPGQPANSVQNNCTLIFPPDHTHAGKWGMFPGFGLFGETHDGILEYPPLPWVPPGFDLTFVPAGPSATKGNDIAVGQNGTIYAAGYCGTNGFGATNIIGFGGQDGFLCQLDAEGNVEWVRNFGGSGTDLVTGIAIDTEENILVAGNFQDTAIFGTTNLTAAAGVSDLFLSKWDANGTLLWAINAGSTNTITCQRIAVDDPGNIYVTGYFQGTAGFGSTNLTSAGSTDIFLAKFNSDGELLWVKQAGGTAADLAFRVAVSPTGESVITGRFQSANCTFASNSLTNAGGLDVFVAKYDTEGDLLWARRDGGSADDWGNGIVLNQAGEIFVTGFYKGTSQFDSTSLTNMGGTTYWDIFLAKYSSDGDLAWIKREGGKYNDLGNDLACDTAGNVYLIFTFYDETIISGATLPSESNFSKMGIVKYSPEGEAIWADSTGHSFGSDGLAIAVDDRGRAAFTGFWLVGSQAIIGRTAVHGPRLRIQQAHDGVVISWPTNFTGFSLETKNDLNAATWSPVEATPVAVVGDFEITLTPSSNRSFFRLRETE